MGRSPCCDKSKVKRGPWSPEEDQILKNYLLNYGTGGNWISLPHKAGLKRCGKSCRLRWLNYLRPDIKHGPFTPEEDYLICTLYNKMGSRWSIIASQLPGRTDNDVKNHWNSKLKKQLMAAPFSKNVIKNACINSASSTSTISTTTTTTTTPLFLETKTEANDPNFSVIPSFLTDEYTDISTVSTEGSKVCSSSKTIEYPSLSSQAHQENSTISFGTINNMSIPWLDNYGYGSIDDHQGFPMEIMSTSAAYSYEIMNGIWSQEAVLEALHGPYNY